MTTTLERPVEERRLLRRARRSQWDVRLAPYLYVSPFFVLFGLVGLFPLVYTGFLAVHDGADVTAHALQHGGGHDAHGIRILCKQQAWAMSAAMLQRQRRRCCSRQYRR